MGTVSRWLLSVAVFAALFMVAPVSAQDGAADLPAHIHAGTCDDPGEIAASLTDLVGPEGDQLGAADATVAASSFSLIATTLDTLLSGDFAIDVHQSSEGGAIACGEIGGAFDGNGALTIGLRPLGDSGFSGIAYLAPDASDPGQVGISTFVAETGAIAASDTSDEGDEADADSGNEPDEETYVVDVRRQVTLLVGSLQRVDGLFEEPRVDDEAWINQLTAELTLWQLLYSEAQETTPPPQYADFQDQYLEALALLDSASMDIFAALESGEQERLDQAGEKIDEAVGLLQDLGGEGDTATPAARITLP